MIIFSLNGRGRRAPDAALVDQVFQGFEAVERGVANEVKGLCDFLNQRYAATDFNKVQFSEVQRIAGTCPTGCAIVDAGQINNGKANSTGFNSRLVARALGD